VPKTDPLTVASLGILAYILGNLIHEDLGHAGACLITGGADLPGWIQPNSPPQSEEVSPEKNKTVPVIPAVHGATGVSPVPGQRRA